MNEQTNQLIRELAEKMGTTTEHLWGVLITQAPISASVDLTLICLMFFVSAGLFYHSAGLKNKSSRSFSNEDAAFICKIFGYVMLLVGCLALLGCANTIIAGFVNPEYWALKQIMQ